MDAGVPLYQALTTLLEQRQTSAFRKCLRGLCAAVLAGNSLSRAMAACPGRFTRFHLAMITAGEKSGDLVTALRRLAEYLEAEHTMRSAIKRELFYSQLTMGLALLLWPGVLFGLRDRPAALIVVGILPLLSFGGLLLVGAVLPRLSGLPLPWLDRVISKVPVLGRTASLIGQTRFARNLSFLYQAGISLPEAVRWAGEASGNVCLAEPLRISASHLDMGDGLAASLSLSGVLDPILITMLKTGELTGNLEVVLDKVAEHFELMTDVARHRLKVSLGVAALLNVGLCVGIILVGFYK